MRVLGVFEETTFRLETLLGVRPLWRGAFFQRQKRFVYHRATGEAEIQLEKL